MKTNNLRIAIQKKGRLTEETISFLAGAGLVFESFRQRLFSSCRNFPLEILFVRDDDIANFVASGVVDLGIVGQNILYEKRPAVKKLLNLRYGFCSLIIAVPKESQINNIKDLMGKTIATSYPKSAQKFFSENNLKVNVINLSGSVEIAPILGVAEAVADLTSTGSTLALNDLRFLTKIYDCEAVLITNWQTLVKGKKALLDNLLTRFKGVLSAQQYKCLMMSAKESDLLRLKKIIPGLKTSMTSSLVKTGEISLQSIIKEDFFWEKVERLKELGVREMTILPIEKIIT